MINISNDMALAILAMFYIVQCFIIVVAVTRMLYWRSWSKRQEECLHSCRKQLDMAYKQNDEIARELKTVVDSAISFIRNPESSRGYDPSTNVGQIAKAVFLKWIRLQETKNQRIFE